jgi:hypothetical protein
MTITLLEARNPKALDADGSLIELECRFSHLPDEWLLFGASASDVEAHCRDAHVRAVAGEFGPIAIYVKPQSEIDGEAVKAKNAEDAAAAKTYAKLTALKQMSPAEVQAWVAANVTNLAQAQDAIATLAIAVSILARRL